MIIAHRFKPISMMMWHGRLLDSTPIIRMILPELPQCCRIAGRNHQTAGCSSPAGEGLHQSGFHLACGRGFPGAWLRHSGGKDQGHTGQR